MFFLRAKWQRNASGTEARPSYCLLLQTGRQTGRVYIFKLILPHVAVSVCDGWTIRTDNTTRRGGSCLIFCCVFCPNMPPPLSPSSSYSTFNSSSSSFSLSSSCLPTPSSSSYFSFPLPIHLSSSSADGREVQRHLCNLCEYREKGKEKSCCNKKTHTHSWSD